MLDEPTNFSIISGDKADQNWGFCRWFYYETLLLRKNVGNQDIRKLIITNLRVCLKIKFDSTVEAELMHLNRKMVELSCSCQSKKCLKVVFELWNVGRKRSKRVHNCFFCSLSIAGILMQQLTFSTWEYSLFVKLRNVPHLFMR